MDSSAKYDNPSPRLSANPISRLIFWWVVPLFLYGKDHDLEAKDLHNALPKDIGKTLGDSLERNWKREQETAIKMGRKPKLLTAIKKTFVLSYIFYGAWIFFHFMVLRVVQPMILGLLIWHFDPRGESTPAEAYMYATGVVVLAISIAFIQHHTFLGQLEIGMRVRIACCSLLYRKILRLSRSAANKTAGGQIINLLSNDVARFDQLFVHLHFVWIMPLQGALVAYLIWQSVQIASLAGVFLITIQTIPLQGYLGKLTSQLRSKIAVRTDERVRLMSEIISGIGVIKMYNWEKPFGRLVSLARRYEVDILTLTSYLRGFNRATYVFTERTTLYFTIMAYVLLGNDVSAVKVFTMAQYFNLMQFSMAILFPMAISAGAEAFVSINRLEAFLLLEEKRPLDSSAQPKENNAVCIKQVSASWVDNSIANTIHDINITIETGQLCALVGPVGAGKSSMLQLILGELEAKQGEVRVGGVVSYASQEPWLFAGSVRNNILFGSPYDEARYRRVTRVCALLRDFAQLPHGDKTRVGERGTSLSGGQRARINLARAVYRNADIYLLDDPLSAVDTHVGKELFEECIVGYLAKKTRILVTHQVQYLKNVDTIIMVNNGVVLKQGTYKEFQQSDLDLIKSITTENGSESDEQPEPGNIESPASRQASVSTDEKEYADDESPETEEFVAKGPKRESVYWKYISAGNSILSIVIFVLIALIGQLGSSGADYFVTYWTNQQELKLREKLHNSSASPANDSGLEGPIFDYTGGLGGTTELVNSNVTGVYTGEHAGLDRDTALWIYGGFIVASVLMTSARNLMFYKMCMKSSTNMHNDMFSCLLKAPMRFFDKNPSGRILNRFSKDIGSVDEILPTTMIEAIQIFAVMIGILGQVVIIHWWTIVPMAIMGFFYGKIRRLYLATARDVKLLEGITKSPVFSHVSSSLSGLATIRSTGKQELVRDEFDNLQDLHTGAYFLSIATSTAFGLWLDFVTITFVAFVTYSFVFLNDGTTFAGDVGLAISQILILCGMLQYGMRQTAEMVAQMTSVERVLELTRLEREGPFDSEPGAKPPANWPTKGEIKFEHVYLSYSEDDGPVLKDVNLAIEPGMKVGIVGRTGAGKSSLISALFNLAILEGDIVIDGINIKKIGLNDLRSRISIIPQEPVLFSSSLRDNIDPFEQYDDATLWSALEQVQLKSVATSLGQIVTQQGSNFSAGQRQLLCLARAIVRNNRILILDEATANVDQSTDRLIQDTIRKEFKNCTVLTIAHRLNTIMDSDRVMVMEQGRLVQFGHPHVLLRDESGYFAKMVDETGKEMSQLLRILAEQAYKKTLREINEEVEIKF